MRDDAPLYTEDDWRIIFTMIRIVRDTKATDEERISAATTLAEVVENAPLEIEEMDFGDPE